MYRKERPTPRHKTQRYRGAQEIGVGEPEGYEQARAAVAKRWQANDAGAAADLSILILAELASGRSGGARGLARIVGARLLPSPG